MSALQHVYVHVPFCSGKCLYCNFYSVRHETACAARYLDALQGELSNATAVHSIVPETLYIGGGTPSALPPPQFQRLLEIIHGALRPDRVCEWTLEGNPGTFTSEKIELLQHFGVNRISLGVQSMNDEILATIGRRHNARETRQTIQSLRRAGFKNIGLDLIACLPGVTSAIWVQTLREALALSPDHLSVYALSVEAGSELERRRRQGDYHPTSLEEEQVALAVAETELTSAGYQHYEVSNYAHEGHHCRHNRAVWQGADYIGLGPAAASRVGTERRTNTADLDSYCATVGASGIRHSVNTERLTPETDAVERFMFTFRLYEGISPEAFANTHGAAAQKLLPSWEQKLSAMKQEGLVTQDGAHWSLTSRGRDFADTVAERLLP
jgi:oxygen-independent coproporphyrinogen III oxidase